YDNSGGALVPAAPSPDQVIHEMQTQDSPSPATQQLVKGETNVAPPAVPVRDAKGNIIRKDWGTPPVPVKKPGDWDFDNKVNERHRDESWRYVSKSESEYRETWSREGGLAHVAQTVMRKEAAMLSVAPSIEAKIATLDQGFLTKAVDHLRLSPSHGPDGFWRSVKQFEDSLSAPERETWAEFCRSLDADEQAALLWGLSK